LLIDTDKLICKAEIAELAFVTPSAVSNWITRLPSFPKPVVTLRIGALYDRDAIQEWLSDREALDHARAERAIELAEARVERLRTRYGRPRK
jgi:hypothetical protein